MKKKEKVQKLPMSASKKIVLAVLGAVAVGVIIYLVYYFIHYLGYDGYKKYLTSYDYETGSELKYIDEANSSVPGFKLVAENDKLKLYTDPVTANVAIYDKRDGSVCYTNPVDADDDTVAKSANKNYLKAQMLVYYYNASVASASWDSYSKSVQTKTFRAEAINNGIRYVYSIGEPKDIKADTGTYFVIPLEYRLDDDSVVVNVPAKGIEEHGPGYIYRIQLLRYMGASTYTDNGYLVVPNGSGSIIRFNNGKTNVAQYSQYVYGIDPMTANYTTLENSDDAKLPIFGICYDDRSILGEVLDGATTSTITAGVSGTYNDRNYVYPTFVTRNIDNLVMFGNATSDTLVMEEDLYDVNYGVRYTFLNKDQTGYSGIANYYRNKLIAEGKLTKNDSSESIPFYYDIISGAKETSHILGVQYLHSFSMTTFDEAAEIVKDLADKGISNQVMNLQGWFNGGYYHDTAKKIRILHKLGGKSDLEDLNDLIKSFGGKLYGDVAFQKVSFADDSYHSSAESSRYYGGGYVAAFGLNDPTTLRSTASLGYSEIRYYLLSPKFLPRYVDKFTKRISKIDIDGISLRDLGNTLESDKKKTNVTDREQALDIVLGQFDKIAETGKNIMLDSSNSYAFEYADDIINVPTDGNQFFICDESIPLYQMIIHGSIDYSSIILNYENKYQMQNMMLQLIETGSAPHYQFTHEAASRMKDTGLNRFYATTYSVYNDDAVEIYKYVNEALSKVSGAYIVNHEIFGDVRAVTYSNGVSIYVNYSDDTVNCNGIDIPGKSYRLEGTK